MMKVVVLNGEMAGNEFPLLYDFNSIGREEGVDIHLPADTSISRRHAVIRKEFGSFIVEDLNSTNGTFLVKPDGQEEEVIHAVIPENGVFRVGKTNLKLVSSERPVVIETKAGERMEVISDAPGDLPIRSAIEHDKLYSTNFIDVPEDQKAVEELNHKIKIFYDIGLALGRLMDLDELLEKILGHIFEMFPAQRGYLMLYDDVTGELETKVVKRRKLDSPENREPDEKKGKKPDKIEVSKTIINQVILEKKAILSDDARLDERFGMPDSVLLHDIRASLYAPMMLEHRVIGVLCIDSFTSSHVFTENDLRLLSIIANQAAQAIENTRLHTNLRRLLLSSIKALANAIEARDVYTRGHSERVTEFSVRLAQAIKMDKNALEKLRYAALLHDIGKIKIREDILNKPGRLTDEEFKIVRLHPVFGARILEPVEEFREIIPYIFHHHERYDGKGYPHGLAGEDIPLTSRILAIADSFDAMTSDRPYHRQMSTEDAVEELKSNSDTQFDPRLVRIFNEIITKENRWLNEVMQATHEQIKFDDFGMDKKKMTTTGTIEIKNTTADEE